MTCINRSDVALQYLAQLRRNDLAASRTTISQYGALLGPGFTKEMILLDLRTHLFVARPEFRSLLAVQLSEAAFQNWVRALPVAPPAPPSLTLVGPVEWCTVGPVETRTAQASTSSTGFLLFAGAAGLLGLAYLSVIFGPSSS